jgi:hypothetical protein
MNCIASTRSNTGTFMSAADGIYMGLRNVQSKGTAGYDRVEGHKWSTCKTVTTVLAFILPEV